jgi:A/G-specific adenine glycosylase
MSPAKFRALIWRFYKNHGRHDLPWRKNYSPYRILVSEIMLQQTQVDRVIPFYANFLRAFPTAKKLGEAPLSNVLRQWQGLGYNRRAKMLHQAAGQLTGIRLGTLQEEALVSALERLPGIGPYTARAVAAFSYNADVTFIETNIRTAIIHHFFSDAGTVTDEKIREVLERVLPKGRSREWHSALMDYGAYLKRSGISYNARSAAHVKQAAFAGSLREARGAILRELTRTDATQAHLEKLFGSDRREQLRSALRDLSHEGLIEQAGRTYRLAE